MKTTQGYSENEELPAANLHKAAVVSLYTNLHKVLIFFQQKQFRNCDLTLDD